MVTGATSLSLVRDELFATMEQAEQGLEQFIAERQNGSLLQHAVECLQQIRGTLNLIELAGAELLAQEALQLATDIPTGVSEERDGQLAALGNALYVLRRYLENVEANRQEIPELLLPAINEVRCAAGSRRCRKASSSAPAWISRGRRAPPSITCLPKPNWARKAGGCATCTRSACSA
ncbi:pilin biosynthetic protein [Pseudomonas aeruginosa PA38182]|nr:pilin biosynthetic protein [Pseudomonas aeruginosa PA38182]